MIARKRPLAGVAIPPAGVDAPNPAGRPPAGEAQPAASPTPRHGRLLRTVRTVAGDAWFGLKVAVPVAVIVYGPIVLVCWLVS